MTLLPPDDDTVPLSRNELIEEARHLATNIEILNKVYLKREDFSKRAKLLYTILTVASIVFVGALITLSVLLANSHSQENKLTNKNVVISERLTNLIGNITNNCQARNKQSAATNDLVNFILNINARAVASHPASVTPLEKRIEARYVKLLTEFRDAQASPVKCSQINDH